MKVNRLYALVLALSLAGFPFVASLATALDVASAPISIAMRIAMLAIGMLIIFLAVIRKNTAFSRGWFWAVLLLFWAAYLLRMFYDTTFRAQWLSRQPDDYWVWAIGACLIPALALLAKVRHVAYQAAYRWSVVALFVAASLVMVFGGTEVMPDWGDSYDIGRLHLESLNPISAGHLGLSLLLLASWPIISNAEKVSRTKWAIVLAAISLGAYLLIAAASRGPIATMFAVICFYILSVNFKKTWKPMGFAGVLVALGYLLAVRFEEAGQFQMLSRIEDAFGGEDVAVSGRQVALTGAFQQFMSSPVFGSALEEEISGFYPHNVVMESFMATGLVGGLPFVGLLAFGFFAAYKLLKWRSENAWVALIFAQYAVAAQFSGAIYGSTTMWTFLAATIALYLGTKRMMACTKSNLAQTGGFYDAGGPACSYQTAVYDQHITPRKCP